MEENQEKLEERDFLVLKASIAEQKAALAQADAAKLAHQNIVLQLFMKYGLTANDVITEDGKIIKNAQKVE